MQKVIVASVALPHGRASDIAVYLGFIIRALCGPLLSKADRD
jgi:hypothetical protein